MISARQDGGKLRLPVLPVAAMLEAQHTLTAVERFAELHEAGAVSTESNLYRDLIPQGLPGAGEQFAFEVDLDACTGCKACVSACHALNGLDSGELWRTVGLLHGGSSAEPRQQTVTTSCHHCVEPACLLGCPTKAYEKDPVTGIVKHLDDQCFGCQYCTLMCPYDAPKYNKSRGIVRKCDMCSDRLAHGEAPACVQACPNEAIAIRIVDQAQAVQASDAQSFLPGAPAPDHTLPTTVYKTKKSMPNNMLPADFHAVKPEHSHTPLVVMLVLTQLSVGAFVLALLVERISGKPAGDPLVQAGLACVLAIVALGASVLHLGRPLLAWRAVLGLRTSWLSREALLFGLFAKLAILYAALAAFAPKILPNLELSSWTPHVQTAAALSGVLGVFSSVMVYVATRRAQWSGTQTSIKFFGTSLLLGAALVLAVSLLTRQHEAPLGREALTLGWLLLAVSFVKISFEATALARHRDRQSGALQRMARLMLGDLRSVTVARFWLLSLGGVALPFALVSSWLPAAWLAPAGVMIVLLLVAGELGERYLFFRAAPASRMPGGMR